MPRRFQFSVRALLVAILTAASFFAGMAVNSREADNLRSSLKTEQESNAKTASIMRGVVTQLMQAKKRIEELEGR